MADTWSLQLQGPYISFWAQQYKKENAVLEFITSFS
jgi:hypothetical protein